jgi:hypothetical protein
MKFGRSQNQKANEIKINNLQAKNAIAIYRQVVEAVLRKADLSKTIPAHIKNFRIKTMEAKRNYRAAAGLRAPAPAGALLVYPVNSSK